MTDLSIPHEVAAELRSDIAKARMANELIHAIYGSALWQQLSRKVERDKEVLFDRVQAIFADGWLCEGCKLHTRKHAMVDEPGGRECDVIHWDAPVESCPALTFEARDD